MNYILKIDSFATHETIRDQQEVLDSAEEGLRIQECDCLWAVIDVHPLDGAVVIADGFKTLDAARQRYPHAITPVEETANVATV